MKKIVVNMTCICESALLEPVIFLPNNGAVGGIACALGRAGKDLHWESSPLSKQKWNMLFLPLLFFPILSGPSTVNGRGGIFADYIL